MLFYKVEAEIVGAREQKAACEDGGQSQETRKEFRESAAWKDFKDGSARHSEEYYQKNGNKTYIFTVGIQKKTHVLAGIISRCKLDLSELVNEYLNLIDAKFQNVTIMETTLSCRRFERRF